MRQTSGREWGVAKTKAKGVAGQSICGSTGWVTGSLDSRGLGLRHSGSYRLQLRLLRADYRLPSTQYEITVVER